MIEKRLDTIVLGTSIAPSDFEKQINAVKSWIENGFYVVSCNTKEEIEIIKPYFSDISIEFVELERDAKQLSGKKLPYIQDILNVVASKTNKVCGYINSDIYMSKVAQGMREFIIKESVGSIIFLRRNEIDNYDDITNLNWDIQFDGIDAFLMDKDCVEDFYDDNFYVQSGWDLCVLIKAKIKQIKIKELVNPITFHLRHRVKWNFEKTNILVKQFMHKYFGVEEIAYKAANDLFYNILYEECRPICFCNDINYRCLFVLDKEDRETIESISMQDYPCIEIQYSDERKEEFDFIFYIKNRLLLNQVFCKTVIYIMTQFECNSLNTGRFFISNRRGKYFFNEINRNMHVVKNINAECDLLSHIIMRGNSGKHAELYFPLSYELLRLQDNDITEKINPMGKAYLMPAGARASEWYNINHQKIKLDIIGFVDNNSDKVGQMISGKMIYPFDAIKSDNEAVTVIVASKYYSVEIEAQLSEQINVVRILNSSYMLTIDGDGSIYYFNVDKYKQKFV